MGRGRDEQDDSASTAADRRAAPHVLVPDAGFLNDLVITRKGVYATDSLDPQLAFVPFGQWAQLPAPGKARRWTRPIALSGDMVPAAGFNANGIVAKGG